MGVCMLAMQLKMVGRRFGILVHEKENDLELFSRGKGMIKEQRAGMFHINLQLANENSEVNSLGVRIFERLNSGMPLLTNCARQFNNQ